MNNAETYPRIAFFTDGYHEANGLAMTSRHLVDFARKHNRPMLVVNCNATKAATREGSLTQVQLSRGAVKLSVEHGMGFDPFLWREVVKVRRAVREFQPDIIHVTSPGDVGLLGFFISRTTPIPLVASWHTNLHEFAACRLGEHCSYLNNPRIEQVALQILQTFYRRARVTLAPNREWVKWLTEKTGKPCLLMQRGIDLTLFNPAKRAAEDGLLRLGYVGRVSPEKNVRLLHQIEEQLLSRGWTNFKFVIVGEGSEVSWLKEHMKTAEFKGMLRGDQLAQAYADLDVLVFPSHTDTFGNVVLEAMASGVVPVVSSRGGPKYLVDHGINGFVSADEGQFAKHLESLRTSPERLGKMRAAARQRVSNLSWESVMEVVYEAYDLALKRGPNTHYQD